MPHKHEFDAVLSKPGSEPNSGFFVVVPPEVVADFGKKGQVRVKVELDGYPCRLAIAPYGGQHLLGVRKEIREAIGKLDGGSVHISMEIDTEPHVIQLPQDVADAMSNEIRVVYDKLPYTHQKEYVEWINEAKKAETRQRRIEKMMQMLNEGVKTPRSS